MEAPVAGTISGSLDKFEGKWTVDGLHFLLRGNLSESIEQWSATATLDYGDKSRLNGTWTISADSLSFVGSTTVSITATKGGNEIKITGDLNLPILQRNTISGQASWSLAGLSE